MALIEPTFQTMNDNIEFLLHQKFLQFLGPDALGVELLERFYLVLIGHGADDLRFVFGAGCVSLKMFNDHVDLGNGELRASCANVDDSDFL